MIYTIDWLEKKNNDWIVVSLTEGAVQEGTTPGKYLQVSLNRIDKKTGQVGFPDFDNLRAGGEVEGEIWQSPKGGWYLFPPRKPKTGGNPAFKSKQIEEAQNRKRGDIEHFQTNKEESIRLASAQRDAVLIVTTQMNNWGESVNDNELVQKEIIKWRNWFLSDDFTNAPPF